MTRESQERAMMDLYSLATRTAYVFTLNSQMARCLLQDDLVAIHFRAAASRSLDMDNRRIALNSVDVDTAVNRNHFNPRFGGEVKASIDFIALLINGRPN